MKINAKRIPGIVKQDRCRKPMITKQHIQAEFLAKHNKRKLEEVNAKNVRKNSEKKESLNFIVKDKVNPCQPKRKRDKEPYINLSDSFFKSFSGPELSIFKIPKEPLKNKATEPSNSVAQTTNTTMLSVRTEAFKPNIASTPLDKIQPLISDPDDFIGVSREMLVNSKDAPTKPEKNENVQSKKINFFNFIDKTAQWINEQCFSHIPDPINEIYEKQKYNEALSPIADSLFELSPQVSDYSQHKAHQKTKNELPIPVFYDTNDKPIEESDDIKNDTLNLFGTSVETRKENSCIQNDLEELFSKDISFFNSPPSSQDLSFESCSSTRKLFESPENSTIFATPGSVFKFEDDDPFKFSPDSTFDNFFDLHSNIPKLDNTFAIFRSPPEQRKSQFRSQRLEKEKSIEAAKDSSLSTYKWTPNIENVTLTEQSISSADFPFSPRNILKNSFKLF
ncbi:CLUMA_CG005954, isoform A [Clunio marinus]|uniref:CLUMA_CG005954, isoform A n=1 Tax=Clunio marinus TaxID=568069 RepID=A0A1J1HWB9_9DIPT|nr:CLUMA_CG005954, isoform A [Clunio marinus]